MCHILYLELNRRVNRLCNFFLDMGMVKGDRVVVLLRNCRQYIELFLLLSKAGGILVPLNWRLALPQRPSLSYEIAAPVSSFLMRSLPEMLF